MCTLPEAKTVLLLEKHRACRETTQSMLATYGYRCLYFDSVESATPFIEQNPNCIVLADHWYAQKILDTPSLKSNTRVIAMTADADPQIKLNCLESGAQQFLVKPYDPERLLSLLSEM